MAGVTPAVLEASDRFRAQLLRQERLAASAMARYYGHIWQQLLPEIEALRTEITALQAAGQELGKAKLWRLQRLRALEQRATQELARFSAFAAQEIAAQERALVALAEKNARALIAAALPPGTPATLITFGTMPIAAIEALVGFLADGSPLATLIKEAVGEAFQDFMDTLVEGLAMGWNPRKLARILRQKFGMALTRALRIARTEQLRAYRTASLRAYQESSVVVGWERHAAMDDRTCMACILLDGKRYTTAEEMDDHVQGRCLTPGQTVETDRGLVAIEDVRLGDRVLTHRGRFQRVTATMRRGYDGQVVTIAQSITLTPEHPVKTGRGWIQAKDLRASDTLLTLNEILVRVSSRSIVQPSSASSASFRSSISRLPSDLCQGGSSSTANFERGKAKSMLNRSMAYSGSGYKLEAASAIMKWNSPGVWLAAQFACLDLARLQRALSVWPASIIALRKSGLFTIWRRMVSCGVMGGMPHLPINRMSDLVLMPSSAVSSRYVAPSSRYRRVRQSQIGSPIRFSRALVHLWEKMRPRSLGVFFNPSALARCWTALVVRSGKSAAMSLASLLQKVTRIKSSSFLVQRFPAIVNLLARIGISIHQGGLNVEWGTYSGTVYNLMVAGDESYIANGIVVHNCAMLPITKSYRELGLNVPEPNFQRELASDWFRRQPPSTQRRMMGATAFDAWQEGAISLDDIPKLTTDDVWGDSWVPKNLEELGL